MAIHLSRAEVQRLLDALKPTERQKCPPREAVDPALADRDWYKKFMADLKAKE